MKLNGRITIGTNWTYCTQMILYLRRHLQRILTAKVLLFEDIHSVSFTEQLKADKAKKAGHSTAVACKDTAQLRIPSKGLQDDVKRAAAVAQFRRCMGRLSHNDLRYYI